ncbi:chromosome segregation ATPase [Paenibacillus shirakamiensis]|uniref:Chromosome segregation ATPase n=1 Tax=Paenibacillus shirakamiensis TaxID=1265935 RepID=A0ABS4JD83_9BACL|nr:AAA family ATPase [Paenibacillus shirakamiensis]MBP1999669.1 chromosome segregation ATPase [Paenibacillus shirakamiensis]
MIKDFSTVYWGYLPMTKEPYKVHGKVNAFIGPSGHGKTTIWDGLRLMLGASHFESKRTFSFYVKNSNWAVVRVAFYNLPVNGLRPFESARKFKDEVTACCRIYKNDQNSWQRDYYIFDGEFNDLVDLQTNTKAYSEAALNVSKYLQTLEQCLGVTKEFRNLMAMSPDTIREVVNSSPREIFHLIFDLKGTKDYKKRYDESKERLSVQEISIERAEEEMEQAQSRFEETKQKAQKFRLYQTKEKEVKEIELKLIKLEYFESQNTLKATNEEIIQVIDNVKLETDKVNELSVQVKFKEKEIEQLNTEYNRWDKFEEQANHDITHHTSEKRVKDTNIKTLVEQINELKLIEPQSIDYLVQLNDVLVESLDQKKIDFSQVRIKLFELKQKLSDLEKDFLPYREDARKFREILEKNKIPFIMLADAINVNPEMSKWQEAIEAYIGNNRFRIIVEPENYLPTKKLQQRARYGARVSLPNKGKDFLVRKVVPYPSIRSAINISHQEKIEGFLKNLSQVYLVETVEEGHALQAKGIESVTIEGLLQDGDGAIHLKYHSLCCGKLAIEEEKKRTKELLSIQEEIFKKLEGDIHKCQSELDEVNTAIINQELLAKLPEMESSYHLILDESKMLSDLIEEAIKQKDQAKEKKEEIRKKERNAGIEQSVFNEQKTQALQKMNELSMKHDVLQTRLNSLASLVQQALSQVKALGLSDDDVAFIFYEVQGSAFRDKLGNFLTSKEIQQRLNALRQEKVELYDSSINDEVVRLVEAQEGQVELLIRNLQGLKEDRNELERTCNDLLFQFRGHIKEIMKEYISEFENLADLLKASTKGRLVEITPEPETWEIHLFIGYDGKEPVAIDGPDLSSGQKASTSLMILLAAISDNSNGRTAPIMFLDEPKARVDDDRGNEIGQLLQITDIQYFITHQQGESLKTIDWIDHAFTCSAREPDKQFANPLILKKHARRSF